MANSNRKNLLIDTHILFWIIVDPKRLGKICSDLLTNADTVYVSTISIFEAAMKAKADKLPFTMDQLIEEIEASGFKLLDINTEHIKVFGTVVLPHKDPFDALLVAQSLSEGIAFVTADQDILSSVYNESLIDARA